MKKQILLLLFVLFAGMNFLRAQDHYQKLLYPNGKVKGEGMLDAEGNLNADWTFYFESGMKKSGGKYVHGKATGCWFFWTENGKLDS